MPTVLWWGRFDPDYSRNRILRQLLTELGWRIVDFRPAISGMADLEARLRRLPKPDLVWVPCFRQRDLAAARRWSRARGIPLVFDPLISAYDKQVFERQKVPPESASAKRLLAWESKLLHSADRVIADTPPHADFFADTLGVPRERLSVVYVGAEETLFHPAPMAPHDAGRSFEVLFYGSFISLQGPEVIVEAARLYQGPPVRWVLLGEGPLRSACEEKAKGLANVTFESWLPYAQLPSRIHQADVLLGVFGTSAKASRVIPNKVFQALACGRPVITRTSLAYPAELSNRSGSGIEWIEGGDAKQLAEVVASLASSRNALASLSERALATYQEFFSSRLIKSQLLEVVSNRKR